MTAAHLVPERLTRESFRAFGNVIEDGAGDNIQINDARFDRFMNLADVDIRGEDSYINISIMRCRIASELPLAITLLERHPLGSQAFMPLQAEPFFVVVAAPGDKPDAASLRAFVSNGHQGINLHCGVWHMPLIGMQVGQRFLVVDCGNADNCDEHRIRPPAMLHSPEVEIR